MVGVEGWVDEERRLEEGAGWGWNGDRRLNRHRSSLEGIGGREWRCRHLNQGGREGVAWC